MGECTYSSTIPDLGTTWMWGASFTSLPLYPQWKEPPVPIRLEAGDLDVYGDNIELYTTELWWDNVIWI
jgi:hypothetical protein